MKTKQDNMIQKIEITVEKTVEAIARIERFIVKYGADLNSNQVERISNKLQKLQNKVRGL